MSKIVEVIEHAVDTVTGGNTIEPMEYLFTVELPGGTGRAVERAAFRTAGAAWQWIADRVSDAEDISGTGPKVRKAVFINK